MSVVYKSKEQQSFHVHLLKIILFVTFSYTFFKATASIYGIFPLSEYYRYTLFFYSMVNLFSLGMLIKNSNHFSLVAQVATLASVVNFSVMAYSSTYDEFRLAWFFFTNVAAFMFLGKKYGVFITLLVIAIIVPMHIWYGMGFSKYAMTTFVSSMLIFAVFIYSFLNKIEKDEKSFQEKIDAEVEKRQTQEDLLLRQQRMQNMGEMIDAIAHQWRQPLNQSNMLIMDIEDTLKDETKLSPHVEKQLNKLTKVTAHMSQTIDDFRHLLHDDKERSTFHVNSVIEDILDLMKSNLSDVKVDHTPISNDEIHGYKNELMQVFIIILSNAVEALQQKDVKDKEISITIQRESDRLDIEIEDNAGGVDSQIIDKIFDPYFTSKKESSGTGLGLYIVKIMVEENMKGTLSVRNTHKGAKFSISIKRGG